MCCVSLAVLPRVEILSSFPFSSQVVDFHEQKEVNGIKFWGYVAGHVLGAAMFMLEIAGVKVLYTGDFSRMEDRHLCAAEIPNVRPDVLITVRSLPLCLRVSLAAPPLTDDVSRNVNEGFPCCFTKLYPRASRILEVPRIHTYLIGTRMCNSACC